MAACGIVAADAPILALTLVGTGKPMLRLEKRLSCADGLGLALDLTVRKKAEALGIPFAKTPAVLADGRVVLTGLQRTEEIEAWLSRRPANGPNDACQSGNKT